MPVISMCLIENFIYCIYQWNEWISVVGRISIFQFIEWELIALEFVALQAWSVSLHRILPFNIKDCSKVILCTMSSFQQYTITWKETMKKHEIQWKIISSMSANISVSFSASPMVVGIVANHKSLMGLDIFIPTIYTITWKETMKNHEIQWKIMNIHTILPPTTLYAHQIWCHL